LSIIRTYLIPICLTFFFICLIFWIRRLSIQYVYERILLSFFASLSVSGCKSTSFFLTRKQIEKKYFFFFLLTHFFKKLNRFADGKGKTFMHSVQIFFKLFSKTY